MNYSEYKNKKVTVFGLGSFGNGPAAVKFFVENGAIVTVTDLKTKEQLQDSYNQIKDLPVKFVLGENSEADFTEADFIFRSPAIPGENKLLKLAKDNGAKILMAEALFLKHFGTKNVVGVTGTKGKTTTASLAHFLLEKLGYKVALAGVPSKSAVELLLSTSEKYDWVVLEISSWDCEGLDELCLSPGVAIISEIDEDHLNRYGGSFENYALSKASIYKYQLEDDVFIISADNRFLNKYLELCVSKGFIYNSSEVLINDIAGKEIFKGELETFSDTKLLGLHNKKNLMANLTLAVSQGFEINKCIGILNDFSSVEGRMQKIGDINGVDFINDTTATAPIAAIASINTFVNSGTVFILGGYDKSLDYSSLAKVVLDKNINYVLLKGSATDKLVEAGLDKSLVYENFKDAILYAYKIALEKKGSVVLSPGAASFGMFENEFDRGNQFIQIFEKLK